MDDRAEYLVHCRDASQTSFAEIDKLGPRRVMEICRNIRIGDRVRVEYADDSFDGRVISTGYNYILVFDGNQTRFVNPAFLQVLERIA
ncbi:MAG: hypothetical protein KDD44_04060 [Bdellovibrionales bacterium]|nr:hypothetical protein [Bdellovibrionales bacterium]